jgi:hypothetical protein
LYINKCSQIFDAVMHETGFTQSVIKSEQLRISGEKHDDDDDDDNL